MGREVPAIFTPPKRELTCKTSHGYSVIDFAERVLGVKLYPWQKWMLIHALELKKNGKYRFRTVVLLVGRQNGKSTLLQVWALWRMYVDHAPLVIGTAQNLDVAEEQWQAAVDMAEDNEDLSAEIADVKKTNGKYTLRLEGGERYKVAAATRKGGRGMSGDLVIMDELREHANWESWSAVTKTTMARKSPQVLCASNAGDASSVVLRHLRKQAIQAIIDGTTDEESLGIFEWSAMVWKDDGGLDKAGDYVNLPTANREGWAMANPSCGWGDLDEDALEAAYRTDPDPVFRTECLCQWVNTTKGGAWEDGVWERNKDAASTIVGGYYVGLDQSWNRQTVTLTAVGYREDGRVHGEVLGVMSPERAVEWFTLPPADANLGYPVRMLDPNLLGVVYQASGAPVSALSVELAKVRYDRGQGVPEARLNLVEWGGTELGKGTGGFYDLVRRGDFRHRGQSVLDVAASMAVAKPVADYWLWDRKKSLVDIASLVAITAAAWALNRVIEEEPESAYSDPDLMFV